MGRSWFRARPHTADMPGPVRYVNRFVRHKGMSGMTDTQACGLGRGNRIGPFTCAWDLAHGSGKRRSFTFVLPRVRLIGARDVPMQPSCLGAEERLNDQS